MKGLLQCKPEASKVTKQNVTASQSVFRIESRRTEVTGPRGNCFSATENSQLTELLLPGWPLHSFDWCAGGTDLHSNFFLHLFLLILCSTSTTVAHKCCDQDSKAGLSFCTMVRRWEVAERVCSLFQAIPHTAKSPIKSLQWTLLEYFHVIQKTCNLCD